jgi:hypothetical protein
MSLTDCPSGFAEENNCNKCFTDTFTDKVQCANCKNNRYEFINTLTETKCELKTCDAGSILT